MKKYIFSLFILFYLIGCGDSETGNTKAKTCTPTCEEWQVCSFEGQCVSDQENGRCETDQDCWGETPKCNIETHSCATVTPYQCYDLDGDGYGAFCEKGDDCNDNNPNIHPDAEEICDDGVDNNCNGYQNEFCNCVEGQIKKCYTGPIQTKNRGICKEGYQVCENGAFSDCQNEVLPQDGEGEEPNGLDDNCDGEIDEGFVLNACGEIGDLEDEICDGLDNNCNGYIDEGCPPCEDGDTRTCFSGIPSKLGVGECHGGVQTCVDGVWSGCENEQLPVDETCDEKDNDCDGFTDEGVTNACGGCGDVGLEVCDGVDNDCDGEVDEGYIDQNGNLVEAANGCGTCETDLPNETCDGVDNDCDGIIDEDCTCSAPQECYNGPDDTVGVGECKAGIQECIGGEYYDPECSGQVLPTIEICDGKDNDCDGLIDEGFQIGESCKNGYGICAVDGVMVCDENKLGSHCEGDTEPLQPEKEICDGLDNDCDGKIDDGYELVGEDCSVGIGICAGEGTYICSDDGLRVECTGVPDLTMATDELCGDSLDNDCDGFTDEGYDLAGAPCYSGVGACKGEGVYQCTPNGLGIECTAEPNEDAATDEMCGDEIDNDCDGFVDEGFHIGEICNNGLEGTCYQESTYQCVDGEQICDVDYSLIGEQELCDGVDNDCDGFVDEGFELRGSTCTAGLGICQTEGIYECSPDGTFLTCSAEIEDLATDEMCGDGLDNDCDGFVDEGFNIGETCNNQLKGTCYREGIYQCQNGEQICTAPEVEGTDEICDSLDNDCDGFTDEGFELKGSTCKAGKGVCENEGVYQCSEDMNSLVCSASPDLDQQDIERCGDNLDNDCDGFIDEGFELVGDSCTSGLGVCQTSGNYICSEDLSSLICNSEPNSSEQGEELCGDGIDNDCDGFIDEGFQLGATCDNEQFGPCYRTGVYICENGHQVCDAETVSGTEELCNGIDDNCDGEVDETFTDLYQVCYSSGTGICQTQGVYVCNESGGLTCNAQEGDPLSEEICNNGVDDNCDGDIDEGCIAPTFTCGTAPDNPTILNTVTLSNSITGVPDNMAWSVISQPVGSNIVLTTPTSDSTTFVPYIAGTYQIEFEISGASNTDQSGEPDRCLYEIFIQPSDSLNVSAIWEYPADIDVHLLNHGASSSDWGTDQDCHYQNCRICPVDVQIPDQTCTPNHQLNWGDSGETSDDPQLDVDNRIGCDSEGICYPENISIESPYGEHYYYTVGIHYYSGQPSGREGDSGPTQNVDVTIHCRDTVTEDITEHVYRCPSMSVGDWCFVRDIDWYNNICTVTSATRVPGNVSTVTPVEQ